MSEHTETSAGSIEGKLTVLLPGWDKVLAVLTPGCDVMHDCYDELLSGITWIIPVSLGIEFGNFIEFNTCSINFLVPIFIPIDCRSFLVNLINALPLMR